MTTTHIEKVMEEIIGKDEKVISYFNPLTHEYKNRKTKKFFVESTSLYTKARNEFRNEIREKLRSSLLHLVQKVERETREKMLKEIIVMGSENSGTQDLYVDGPDWKEYKKEVLSTLKEEI